MHGTFFKETKARPVWGWSSIGRVLALHTGSPGSMKHLIKPGVVAACLPVSPDLGRLSQENWDQEFKITLHIITS